MKRLSGITTGLDALVAPREDTDTQTRFREALALLAGAGQSYWEVCGAETLTAEAGAEVLHTLAMGAGIKLIGRLPFVPGETIAETAQRAADFAMSFDAVILDGFGRYAAEPGEGPSGAEHTDEGTAKVAAVKAALKGKELFADDTGVSSPAVNRLLSGNGLACTRVLSNGFSGRESANRDLPHNYPANCVAYLSTPDGEGIMHFLYHGNPLEVGFAVDYLNLTEREGYAYGFLRGLMASPAALTLIPLRDILPAGGTFTDRELRRLRYYTRLFGRCGK